MPLEDFFQMDDYLDFLKSYDGIDKYILFSLWLCDWSIADIAAALSVTRQTIYNVIARNQEIYDKYIRPKRDSA